MSKIQIYARIRPSEVCRRYGGLTATENRIHVKLGESTENGSRTRHSGHPATRHEFKFTHVFQEDAPQEEIFDMAARKVVDSFLMGYNGTIFAYGQTSSGKTYTIEGSGRRFAERGLIPRILSTVYESIEGRVEGGREEVSVHVSYMEIYQDTGYDLLNPGMRPGALMVTLPKVHITEGPGGEVVVRNLSSHLAASEEVAQSLLFQGSTCRTVAETSMNQCSSRSHSIFTITLTAREHDSEVITRSKLNLVDLAGSERVAKTGADGRILQEAKHINLSLHHLEHVIVALQQQSRQSTPRTPQGSRSGHSASGSSRTAEQGRIATSKSTRLFDSQNHHRGMSRKSRSLSRGDDRVLPSRSLSYGVGRSPSRPMSRGGGYIPYRNCMLTMVLRDSLGGNCLTAMIATLSAEETNILETVSTCRFSQRVACIANRARRNEELDDKAVIKKLKLRVAELEREAADLRQGLGNREQGSISGQESVTGSLTDSEKQLCHRVLYDFFHGNTDNPVAAGINTVAKFQECLSVLKQIVLHALGINKSLSNLDSGNEPSPATGSGGGVEGFRLDPALEALPPGVRLERKPDTLTAKTIKSKSNSTPSPNSRLSSGFGSLRDEDGSLFESGHLDVLRQSSSSANASQSTSVSPRSHPSRQKISPSMSQNENKSRSHPRGVTASSPQVQSSQLQSKLKGQPNNHDKASKQLATAGKKSSRHVHQQPSEVVTEKPQVVGFQSPQRRQEETHPFTAHPPSPQTSPMANPLSPRQHHQLGGGHTHLKGERQKLVSEVQVLNLKVQEEELRNHLLQTGEQLAQQHVRVVASQQGGAMAEQICAERIAEQQLRIKQAKLHQKLLDVQHRMRMMNFDLQVPTTSPTVMPTGINTAPLSPPPAHPPLPPHSPQSPSQISNELARQEKTQSKVQEQIEKLRLVQMEKQLELKEAATRRKLLTLKQQLQAGTNSLPPQSSKPQAAGVFPGSSAPHSTHGSDRPLKPPSTAPGTRNSVAQRPAVPRSESDRLGISVGGTRITQQWTSLVRDTGRREDSRTGEATLSSFTTPNQVSKTTQKESIPTVEQTTDLKGHCKSSSATASSLSATSSRIASQPIQQVIERDALQTYSKLTLVGAQGQPSCKASESKLLQPKETQVLVKSATPTASIKSAPPSGSQPSRVRLTLPEEIKETEYMSALQRQKARVSRIRRCIVAATVIQRAWRAHRLKT